MRKNGVFVHTQGGFSRQGAPRKGQAPGRASLDHLVCGGNKASGSARSAKRIWKGVDDVIGGGEGAQRRHQGC